MPPHIRGKPFSRNFFRHGGKHVVAKAVFPALAGFKQKRLLRKIFNRLHRGAKPARFFFRPFQRRAIQIIRKARRHRKQLFYGNRLFRLANHDFVAFFLPYAHMPEFRKNVRKFCVQGKLSFFDQLHRRRARNQFRAGIHIVPFFPRHRRSAFFIGNARMVAVYLFAVIINA